MMTPFRSLLLLFCLLYCHTGFSKVPAKKSKTQLFVTTTQKIVPYVWQGENAPLTVDTLRITDPKLEKILIDNIAPDTLSIPGKVVFSGNYYNIQIDSLGELARLTCYHPRDRVRDFYEYAKRLIARDRGDVYFRDLSEIFGYVVINGVPLLISGNAAADYFKKERPIILSNPYPANAIIYDNSGLLPEDPKSKYSGFGSDNYVIDSYLYKNGALETYRMHRPENPFR